MLAIPCWLVSSLTRIYPASPAGGTQEIALRAARGERISFQACLRNPTIGALKARLVVAAPDDLHTMVRRVGYVPMAHHNTETEAAELDGVGHIPGLVPDPLFPEDAVTLGPWESHAFWVTVVVAADIAPGTRTISVHFVVQDEALPPLRVHVDVCSLVAQPPRAFPVTHWFYADALCDWYKVAPFEEPFWAIVRPYMQDMVAHGGSSLYVPLFTPPTDGVKRPTQLLRVSTPAPGQYQFDFGDVQRWVRLARASGARYLEWTHLFWQWGVKYALRVYRSNADPTSLLWPPETGATSDTYRTFLAQFLPQFHAFLQTEGLLGCSLFHLSDEPHGDEHLQAYQHARALLRELAPWMKVADAMSDIRYGREGVTDIPIPSIRVAQEYIEARIPSWVYWCCGPRGPYVQRLMDTPLPKLRMAGWLFYHLGAQGFLHWGYNYWYKSQTQQLIDPYAVQDGLAWPGWAYGDTFQVYPGPSGPVDSLRWEVWAESLQDYGLLESAGMRPDDPLLAEIRSYSDFPKSEAWIKAARRVILVGR